MPLIEAGIQFLRGACGQHAVVDALWHTHRRVPSDRPVLRGGEDGIPLAEQRGVRPQHSIMDTMFLFCRLQSFKE